MLGAPLWPPTPFNLRQKIILLFESEYIYVYSVYMLKMNILVLLALVVGGCSSTKWKQKPYSQNFNPLMEVHDEELVV
jgi:hypothetical protein